MKLTLCREDSAFRKAGRKSLDNENTTVCAADVPLCDRCNTVNGHLFEGLLVKFNAQNEADRS